MNIEESIDQIETLIEAWELDEAELNQTDINAMQVLLKEIQELELELSGYRQAILNNKEMLGLKDQNDKLKKQVDDANEKILLLQASEPMLNYKKALEKTQQKKFIKYLEDENKKLDVKANGMGASSERDELITNARAYRKILQKYKSIIGVLDENNKQ